MALSKLELSQLVEDTSKHDPFRTWRQRDDQMYFRSLYVKHDPQLEALGPMYQRKLARIIDYYDSMRQGLQNVPQAELEEALLAQERKIRRIAEKMRDVEFEIRGRGLDQFKRNPIGTEYYIDLDGGNNSNDGLSPGSAWLTIEQYTTTTVRSPGDIAWVRAGTSEVAGNDIVCDEDGTRAAPIHIIGCTAGSGSGSDDPDDPWGDDVDTKPQVDFNAGLYTFYLSGDYSWHFKNFHIRRCGDTSYDAANLSINSCLGIHGESCEFSEGASSFAPGIRVLYSKVKFTDCDFWGNTQYGIYGYNNPSEMYFYRCRCNGGGAYGQDYGFANAAGNAYFEECEFGLDTAHDVDDILTSSGAVVIFRSCSFNDFNQPSSVYRGCTFWENCTGLPVGWSEDGGVYAPGGCLTEKVDTPLPSGYSGYSLKVTPGSSFMGYGNDWGLAHSAVPYFGPLRLWLDAGTYTITVKVRAQSAYGTYPTAAELFLKASYFDESSTFSIAEAVSDEVLSDGSTWVDFQVTITTGREGPVYLDVFIDDYESGKGIYVYPFPEVS